MRVASYVSRAQYGVTPEAIAHTRRAFANTVEGYTKRELVRMCVDSRVQYRAEGDWKSYGYFRWADGTKLTKSEVARLYFENKVGSALVAASLD